MKNKRLIIFSIFLLIVASSCRDNNENIACTMEFRIVIITVNGNPLNEYYTVRESTNDTIRIDRSNVTGNNVYPVLDDSYQNIIEGRTENFIFYGKVNGVITAREPFVIKADKCHIEYVSGRQVI